MARARARRGGLGEVHAASEPPRVWRPLHKSHPFDSTSACLRKALKDGWADIHKPLLAQAAPPLPAGARAETAKPCRYAGRCVCQPCDRPLVAGVRAFVAWLRAAVQKGAPTRALYDAGLLIAKVIPVAEGVAAGVQPGREVAWLHISYGNLNTHVFTLWPLQAATDAASFAQPAPPGMVILHPLLRGATRGPLGMHEALRRLLHEGAPSWDGEWWALTRARHETREFTPGILHAEPVRGVERVPVWRLAPEWRLLPIRRAPRPGPLVGLEGWRTPWLPSRRPLPVGMPRGSSWPI